jgi:hypothetical protein
MRATLHRHPTGEWESAYSEKRKDIHGHPEHKGIAQHLYNGIDKHLGEKLGPADYLTPQGRHAIWGKRDPEAVKHHQWSETEGHYLSPHGVHSAMEYHKEDIKNAETPEERAVAEHGHKKLSELWANVHPRQQAKAKKLHAARAKLVEARRKDFQ